METQNYFSISKGISTTRGDGRLRELRSDKGFDGMAWMEWAAWASRRFPEKSVLKEMQMSRGTQQGSPSFRERAGMFQCFNCCLLYSDCTACAWPSWSFKAAHYKGLSSHCRCFSRSFDHQSVLTLSKWPAVFTSIHPLPCLSSFTCKWLSLQGSCRLGTMENLLEVGREHCENWGLWCGILPRVIK